ncbi:peptidoglycan-binding domain-containing protein [Rhodococcus sp. PD04]|uniref:peptidoglycan-binding domain-containing protein n=1 Tax=Rhodococcus sp. PD04 TaxID=3109594 RepID=UPI002DDA1361|nr:peptidoglycan-binding domain-containing protein [Rhodococcus sp. PD04]WSE22317.1 peptidoglycan-binding domain-containing protein [Rhodococcus sp. PD04]
MAISRARVNAAHGFAHYYAGQPYAYGGNGTAATNWSGDCSWAVCAAAAILHGKSPHTRYGSTESFRLRYRELTDALPLLRRADNMAAVPANAILRIGNQHGGGGANSHTACSIEGMSFESRGWPGVVYGPGSTAANPSGNTPRAWNSELFRPSNDFWYIAGPIDESSGPVSPDVFPLGGELLYYGPSSGPWESIGCESGEHWSWIAGLKLWQKAAGVPETGRYDAATERRAKQLQAEAGDPASGRIGPKTWALAFRKTNTGGLLSALTDKEQREVLEGIRAIRSALLDPQPSIANEAERFDMPTYARLADFHSYSTHELVKKIAKKTGAAE